MRTQHIFLISASLSIGACNWTEFDDIASKTWVDASAKPDGVKSSDWGVAIQRGADAGEAGSSGTLAVIGAGEGSYAELEYNAQGSASFKSNSLALGDQGIMTLDSPPILLASPKNAEVALVTTGNSSSIVVATGVHTLLVRQLFVTQTTLGDGAGIGTTPDAAAYLQPKPFPGGDQNPGPEPLVAVGDVVMGTIYMLPNGQRQPACKLTDGANPIQVRAIAAVPGPGTTDDFLVWNGADGKLLKYHGDDAFNGCTTVAPVAPTATQTKPAFAPGHGSQILKIDATHVLLQGHQDIAKGNASFMQVYDISTLQPVGMPIAAEGLRSAAVLTVGATSYAVAGYPLTTHDGASTAGEVQIFELAPTTQGIASATPTATLHDAQPEANQQFGRSVAVMPYNGKNVIAVSADNEVFVYFRANRADGQAIYDESRQGK